jgi:glucose/arabinose dehydrogenase
MKKIILLFVAITCSIQIVKAQLTLTDAFPSLNFTQPIELVSADDQTNRIFVASQTGTIHVFPNNAAATTSKVFLNMTEQVISGGERGLLGLAFHPDYKNNGYFYVSYNRKSDGLRVISRYKTSTTDTDKADPLSELVLITYVQPFTNHNGGKIAFGNDGYLYIATGDGGSGGDPLNNAQNRTVLLGKILRIDVNTAAPNLNYSIPADNPYVNNTQGFLPEIYAYGLRNPWKFSVDRETGTIWVGDVGQGQREEVDILVKGGNYGWRLMEGNLCFNPAQNCNPGDLITPIHEYDRSASGGVSITGGFVYRGAIPYLYGKYIYGDFGSRNMWALTSNTDGTVSNEFLQNFSGGISAFGEDQFKELYACNYSNGKIYKFSDPFVAAPTTLTAVVSENSVALTWTDNAYNETSYTIERALAEGGPYTVIATLGANSVTFTDTNLATVTTYYYRINASNAASGFNSAYTSTVSATTTKLSQTITFDALPDRVLGDAPFDISASASSGLPVSFFILSGPASISASDIVSVTDTGTVSIRASQLGNEVYNAALPVEQRFRVVARNQLSFVASPADRALHVSVEPTIIFKVIEKATSYTIELNDKADFTGTPLLFTSNSIITKVSGLDTSTTYYARVKTDLLNNMWGSTTSFTTAGAESLTYITSPAEGDTSVSVSPSLVSKEVLGATRYTFEINTKADFSNTSLVQERLVYYTQYIDLDSNTTYYTRVKTDLLPDIWGPVISFKTLSATTITSLINQDQIQFQVKAYPNPVDEFLTINFHLPLQAEVSLQLYNSLSICVAQLINPQKLQPGDHRISYNIDSFPAGIYLYRLKINTQLIAGRIQVSR